MRDKAFNTGMIVISMKKEVRLYIFRHGRTFFNEKHRFTGWKDSELSPAGVKDARIIALQLKKKKIGLAFTSDLSRAQQTLKEVLKYHPGVETLVDRRLRERSYGALEGKSHQTFIMKEGNEDYKTLLHWHKIDHLRGAEKQEFIKRLGEAELKVRRRSFYASPPKGESIQAVEKRIREFLKDLFKIIKERKVNIAISAHGNSIRPIRKYFEHLTPGQTMDIEQPFDKAIVYRIKI